MEIGVLGVFSLIEIAPTSPKTLEELEKINFELGFFLIISKTFKVPSIFILFVIIGFLELYLTPG